MLRLPLGRFDRQAQQKRSASQSAVIRAAMLDMELSQSVYLEARSRRANPTWEVAADLDRAIAATVASVTTTADALQQSAHRMDELARTTVAEALAAETAATQTPSNVNAVSAATTQLSYSGQGNRPADPPFP